MTLTDSSLATPPALTDAVINSFMDDKILAEDLPAPQWGPIGREVYERSYSRDIIDPAGLVVDSWTWQVPESRTSELWGDTVRRVVSGNIGYADDMGINTSPCEALDLFRMIYDFKIVPAGRHLWMTGVPGAALKNCHRSGWSKDITDHFRFLAIQLFQGGGVGANYSKFYRERGGNVVGNVDVRVTISESHDDYASVKSSADGLWIGDEDFNVLPFVVEDTREGWVDAWVELIRLYHTPGDHSVVFDLTEVRPHGAPLRAFGGRASGPSPLAGSLVSISAILEKVENDTLMSAIDAMVIDHYIASAIVAGGTRRSARMSQLNWNDPEVFDFIKHKRNDPSVSWSTNISVVLDDDFHSALEGGDAHASEVLHAIAEGMAADGEPGIYNLSLAQVGEKRDVGATNPCGEAILEEHYDPETGEGSASGESCNLGSVDMDAIGNNHTEAVEAFRLMSRFLYRATLAPIYDADQAEIEFRNRRLGVGVMGFQGWCASHGIKLTEFPDSEELLNKMTEYRLACRDAADTLAEELDLPAPIKVTAIAPTGSIAQLRGTTAGLHPVYARYFIRRIQYADTAPTLQEMIDAGYPVEDSIYAAHTKVVAIPVKDIILDRHAEELIEQSDEVGVGSFLAVQAALQDTFCGGLDGQAISATAQIPPDTSPDLLTETLHEYVHRIKGATVFPALSRPQQPITSVSKGDWAIALLELGNSNGLSLHGDSNDGDCVGGACPIR